MAKPVKKQEISEKERSSTELLKEGSATKQSSSTNHRSKLSSGRQYLGSKNSQNSETNLKENIRKFLTVQPPLGFATVVKQPTNVKQPTKDSSSSLGSAPSGKVVIHPRNKSENTIRTEERTSSNDESESRTEHRLSSSKFSFLGSSIHHGSLPFITINGIFISFSPILLFLIAGVAVASLIIIDGYPNNLLFLIYFLSLLFCQLAGHLLFGWLTGTQATSLLLSATGVVDPELVFRERFHPSLEGSQSRIFETNEGMYMQSSPSQRLTPLEEEDSHSEDSLIKRLQVAQIQREFRSEQVSYQRAPVRALGASVGALAFLGALSVVPMTELLSEHASLIEPFWWYTAFLVIAPFLPPHTLNEGFKVQLTSSLYPLGFFLTLLFLLPESISGGVLSGLLDLEAVLFFGIFALGRKIWWSRVISLSHTAQALTVSDAMMPFHNFLTFSHGDSIESAQQQALRVPQEIFPLISGNRLTGFIMKGELLRLHGSSLKQSFVSGIAHQHIALADSEMNLETCFSSKAEFPLFVVEDGDVVGIVSSDSVRDALLLELSKGLDDDQPDDFL